MRTSAAVSIAECQSERAVLERTLAVACELTRAESGHALPFGADGEVALDILWGEPAPHGHLARGLDDTRPGEGHFVLGHGDTGPQGSTVPAIVVVPILTGDTTLGALHLQRPTPTRSFRPPARELLDSLATQCASVIGRLRSARANDELLTNLQLTAQRAGDVHAAAEPSAVIRRLLSTARGLLGMELAFLSRISDGEQVFSVVEASMSAPALVEGTVIDSADGYCRLLLEGSIPPAVPDLRAHPLLGAMPVTAELQAGAYCGVSVRLPDGSLYGTLCGLHSERTPAPSNAQLEALAVIAGLLGHSLAAEPECQRRRQADRLAFLQMVDSDRRSTVVQPIVDLLDGGTVGYEALSRFVADNGSALRPDNVFAQAAALGLLVHLEQAAARSALNLLPQLPSETYLSINLSPATLLEPSTRHLLGSSGAVDRLVVEVTEHEEVADYPGIREALSDLRVAGLRLAVDDTGAHFASLQHLTQLGPDVIKLDVAFVRDIEGAPACQAVARAIAGYAAEVGAVLIAEGVEVREQATLLRDLGVAYGQGYFFARPQPAARFFSAEPQELLPRRG